MGISCYTITITNFIFSNLMRPNLSHTHTRSIDEFRPPPSLVLLPDFLTAKSVDKDRLPIVEYSAFGSHNEEEFEEEGDDCAICLRKIEAWHNVRDLGNCEHAFHVECIDSWIGRGGGTCPVCRARLVSGHGEVGHGKDPWRSQRMVYLFGEDCLMEELY